MNKLAGSLEFTTDVLMCNEELLGVAEQLGYTPLYVDVGTLRFCIPPTEQQWIALKRAVRRVGKPFVLDCFPVGVHEVKVQAQAERLSYPRVLDGDTDYWIVQHPTAESWDYAIRNFHAWEYLSDLADRKVLLFRTDQVIDHRVQELVVDEREIVKLFTECGLPRLWIYSERDNLLVATRDVERILQFVRDGYGGWLCEKLRYRERVNTEYIRALERTIAKLSGAHFTGSPIADLLDRTPDWYLYRKVITKLERELTELMAEQKKHEREMDKQPIHGLRVKRG